ncbi:MAG TPA: YrdB family protein [Patescibacteria group bacterium]|nr:YrdB family protein [Patescibacteria group bacterium]
MKTVALTLAFLLEIVAFIGFATIGYAFDLNSAMHVVLFFVLLALVTVFWGLFMAPKAPKKFHASNYYMAKLVIYGIATASLLSNNGPGASALFIVAAIVDEAILYKHNLA